MKTYTGCSGGTYTKCEDVDAALKEMKVTPDILAIIFIAAAVKRKIGFFSSKSEVSFTDPVLGYAYWYFIDNFIIHGMLGNAFVFPGLGAADETVEKKALDILKENATAKMAVFDTILTGSPSGIQASSIRAHFFQAVEEAPP